MLRSSTGSISFGNNTGFLDYIKERNIQQINLSYNKAFPKGVLIINKDLKKLHEDLCAPGRSLREYLEKNNKTVITRTELESFPSSSQETSDNHRGEDSFNWKPWIIGGMALVLLGIGIWLFIRNKKKRK